MMVDQTPLSMESCPSEGPTVRSSRILTGAGRAPALTGPARAAAVVHLSRLLCRGWGSSYAASLNGGGGGVLFIRADEVGLGWGVEKGGDGR